MSDRALLLVGMIIGIVIFGTWCVHLVLEIRRITRKHDALVATVLEMSGESRAARTIAAPAPPAAPQREVPPHQEPRQVGLSPR